MQASWVVLVAGALTQVLSLHVVFHTQAFPEEFLSHAAYTVATEHEPLLIHPVPVVIQVLKKP